MNASGKRLASEGLLATDSRGGTKAGNGSCPCAASVAE